MLLKFPSGTQRWKVQKYGILGCEKGVVCVQFVSKSQKYPPLKKVTVTVLVLLLKYRNQHKTQTTQKPNTRTEVSKYGRTIHMLERYIQNNTYNWSKSIKIMLYFLHWNSTERNRKQLVEINIEFAGFGADDYCLVQNRNQIENLVLDIIIYLYIGNIFCLLDMFRYLVKIGAW